MSIVEINMSEIEFNTVVQALIQGSIARNTDKGRYYRYTTVWFKDQSCAHIWECVPSTIVLVDKYGNDIATIRGA